MGTGSRLGMVAAAIAIGCGASAVALARGGSYTIDQIKVAGSVEKGRPFGITVTGFSKASSRLTLFLDHQKCAATTEAEYDQDGKYRSGYSAFLNGATPVSFTWIYPVKSPGNHLFTESFAGYAGTKTGNQYICAYLTPTKSNTPTRAQGSVSDTVTK